MSFTSFSQNFEDVLLWRALGDVERGRYLDIGAQDPLQDSVSLAFYNAGWRGWHVEPTPAYAERLREARPDERVIQAAVSAQAGPISFFEIPETGLSTGDSEIAQRHVQVGFNRRELLVPTVRLSRLLEQTGEVHWLKIDVEGMEGDVLASWDDSAIRPWLLVIEATAPNSQEPTHQEWEPLVVERGYDPVHFDGLSRYYLHSAHRERADRFGTPPNLFDGFRITERHFSAGLLAEQAAAERTAASERIAGLDEQVQEGHRRASAADQARAAAEVHAARLAQALDEAQASATDARRQAALLEAERLTHLQAAAAAEADHRRSIEQARTAEADHRRSIEQARTVEAALHAELLEATRKLVAAREEHGREQLQERTERLTAEAARDAAQAALDRVTQQSAEQGALVASLQQQFGAVQAVLMNALAQPEARWQRLGRVLGLAREDAARVALRSWSALPPSLPSSSGDAVLPAPPPTEARNPYLRANSLAELLSWDDVDFVRCAYVTVLGRQPERQGEAYYLGRIRQGYSKLEILWQLRKSPEGPRHDPGIAGFDRALKREARRRNPYYGWLARLVIRGEGVSAADRRFRQLQNSLAVIGNDQSRQAHALAAMREQNDAILTKLGAVGDQVWHLSQDLARGAAGRPAAAASGVDDDQLNPKRQLDTLDLSSRARAVLSMLQTARY